MQKCSKISEVHPSVSEYRLQSPRGLVVLSVATVATCRQQGQHEELGKHKIELLIQAKYQPFSGVKFSYRSAKKHWIQHGPLKNLPFLGHQPEEQNIGSTVKIRMNTFTHWNKTHIFLTNTEEMKQIPLIFLMFLLGTWALFTYPTASYSPAISCHVPAK